MLALIEKPQALAFYLKRCLSDFFQDFSNSNLPHMKDLMDDFRLYAGILRWVGSTLTVGMTRSDRRPALLSLYHAYLNKQSVYYTPIDPYIIPKTDVFELFGNDSAVYEGIYEYGFEHIKEFELKVISIFSQESQKDARFKDIKHIGGTSILILQL
ncbi:hypothetical protein [Dyadobacter chenhuakuii]|uniref:Uncharacterized protein n=1 Tax=Dyadobacter chenhuakuii TaxID=2909339 RepID=A0ABY4XIW7_9BACT|nr:hypothetical protein [Dyadobacter chenhuakuii]MCF2496306.1 hypothetical protein [Dyadobacter chenhuakuii]USJ30366.1 hypothetical protein NFI80_21210 [Dyadobacter chenhuakuii]